MALIFYQFMMTYLITMTEIYGDSVLSLLSAQGGILVANYPISFV